jgi:peptide/nickel transport system permease protein
MATYLLRRLLLLPVTLFFILLVNFCIINLAPGEPTTLTEISLEGAAKRSEKGSLAFGNDMRYLQFRERYGLTLPIILNVWPWITKEEVKKNLETLANQQSMAVKEYNSLKVLVGDQSAFVMDKLLELMKDPEKEIRLLANHFFIRGGTRQAVVGPVITQKQREENRKISKDNQFLKEQMISKKDSFDLEKKKIEALSNWYVEKGVLLGFNLNVRQKIYTLFKTRFTRYMTKILTLDFGTLRNDETKTVVQEVVKRFKYSLTLSVTPLIVTFFICQFFGMVMTFNQGSLLDTSLNILFLILFAIPVFVVAPFLIEKVALKMDFPFTNISIPISGFSSSSAIYDKLPSYLRILDVLKHLTLPLIALTYGMLAVSSRLSRTAFLEVARQDYIRLARAKGVSTFSLATRHIGRNGSITILTSIAGSLGALLGGSLIVETLFEIDGFGRFFYEGILNRDYNVMLFSTISSAFLTLLGYLVADISYMLLDPRVSLE